MLTIEVGGRKAWVFQRVKDGNFYLKGNAPGIFRSTGFSTKGMALDAARKLWKAALEGRLDALDSTKLKKTREVATIGEIVQAHALAGEKGHLEVKADVGAAYRNCLRRVVAWAKGTHGRPVGKVRDQVDAAAVDKLSSEILSQELVEEFCRNYVAAAGGDMLERDQRLRGAHSILRNARALFEGRALSVYKGLTLPDLGKFLAAALRKAVPVEHESLSDKAVREMATEALKLREVEDPLYLVHLLFRHVGMRNDEIENMRVEWIEEFAEPRAVFLPDGSKREIAGVVAIRRRSYWVPKRSAGDVPLSADVLAELEKWTKDRQGDEVLVPAATATDRWELIYRRHSDFVRPWTGDRQKTSYELRRWGATKIARLHQSAEMADRFLRHARTTTAERHYLTELPLPCPITLADCGV